MIQSLALLLSPPPYQEEVCPFLPLGGFPLFYPVNWYEYLGEGVVFLLRLKAFMWSSSPIVCTDSEFLDFSAHDSVQF